MKKCMLCGRKITNTNYNFGLGCLKKMSSSINISNVKSLKGEKLLDKEVAKICNKKNLDNNKRKLLTNRYFTLKLLNEVPLKCYDNYRQLIQEDISKIDNKLSINGLNSFNVISLNQAYDINKKYNQNKDIFTKILDGEYDVIQNISFEVVRFAFSIYYNKKPYLSDMIQVLQLYILKSMVEGLKICGYNCTARFLEHSLQENPEDITEVDNNIISEIKNDINFKKCVNDIIKKYRNKKEFYTGDKKESFSFERGDLYLSLHNVYINVYGKQNEENKWNIDVTLSDVYDFTDFKEIREYIEGNNILKAFLGSTANNIAMVGTACNVVHEYNIKLKFKIEGWEV